MLIASAKGLSKENILKVFERKPSVDNVHKRGWRKPKAAGRRLGNANAAEDRPAKLQYKVRHWKDSSGGSIQPAAADLWDGSFVWRWMRHPGIWDRSEKAIKWTMLSGPFGGVWRSRDRVTQTLAGVINNSTWDNDLKKPIRHCHWVSQRSGKGLEEIPPRN